MKSKQVRTSTIEEWVGIVGLPRAISKMIQEGLSVSFSEKVAHGRYGYKVRSTSLDAIKKAMADDGFTLSYSDNSRAV